MSKRAEEKALEIFPVRKIHYGLTCDAYSERDANLYKRALFCMGYEQAEKDLAPLIEAATIVYEAWNGGTMDDVRREMVELGKRIMEAKK